MGRKIHYSDKLLELLLRRRRPHVYAKPENQIKQTMHVNVPTLEDLRKRYKELGLTPPVIEGDYEELTEVETKRRMIYAGFLWF